MARLISTHLKDEGKARMKLEKTKIFVNYGEVANLVFVERAS